MLSTRLLDFTGDKNTSHLLL